MSARLATKKERRDLKVTESSDNKMDMLPEYHFDYAKAKSNRFTKVPRITVTLVPDVAEVFTTSEAVNQALRAILAAIPKSITQGKV